MQEEKVRYVIRLDISPSSSKEEVAKDIQEVYDTIQAHISAMAHLDDPYLSPSELVSDLVIHKESGEITLDACWFWIDFICPVILNPGWKVEPRIDNDHHMVILVHKS